MSTKLKLSSNSSTPAKLKQSDVSACVSPVKSGKYRNFLASVLTPSQTKKWIKRKKSKDKSEESFEVVKDETKKVLEDPQLSDDFHEPGYSSVQDLQLRQLYTSEPGIESASLVSAEQIQGSSQHYALCVTEEPLYATVNKQKKNENKDHTTSKDLEFSVIQESNKSSLVKNQSIYKAKVEDESLYGRNVIEEQKEEIKLLVERLKELTNENRELRNNMETILKEDKWKEDSLHAELKLKISKLEAETHKEVNCLSEQIQTLQKERKVLVDQIDILYEEKKSLQTKYNDVCSKVKSMVSPEFLNKIQNDHQRLLKQLEKKHQEEIKNLLNKNELLLESKISLTNEVEDFREKIKVLVMQNETLKHSEQELLEENSRILLQLKESKQIQQEAQTTLSALLKITESISVERDILSNKASYQDHQQNLLKSSIMDYSLNMGRLQEHISNFSKEKLDELQKLKTGEFIRDESLKNFYDGQLELLRSKVLNQSSTINDLESEKGKLELQLESLWQVACIGKPKLLEDIKYNT